MIHSTSDHSQLQRLIVHHRNPLSYEVQTQRPAPRGGDDQTRTRRSQSEEAGVGSVDGESETHALVVQTSDHQLRHAEARNQLWRDAHAVCMQA